MSGSERHLSPFEAVVEAVESMQVLDGPADAIGNVVREQVGPGALKDAISGTWLGHPLHPVMTDVVIGSFMSATILDLFGGDAAAPAAQVVTAAGILAYGPTAAAGVSDFTDSLVDDRIKRAGVVHASANAIAMTLYLLSMRARRRGRRGTVWSLAGAAVLSAGGFLGGHLSFRRGVGPDQTIFDPGPDEWTRAADASAVAEGRPTQVVVGETPVLLLRRGGRVVAMHDRCSHRGCSLADGEIEGDEIVCPCHGSRFALEDGALRRGPAVAPQPSYEVREQAGAVEIRLRGPS